MVVGNMTAHQALTISHRVAQSQVPLKIMMAPMCTQAGAVSAYMKFVEFLTGCVVALQERLGPPDALSVPLESESGAQSTTKWERSSSPLPARKSPPASRHGSATRTDSGKKASAPSSMNKDIFSPQSQNSMSLWASLNLSDDEMNETYSDEVKQTKPPNSLTPSGETPT